MIQVFLYAAKMCAKSGHWHACLSCLGDALGECNRMIVSEHEHERAEAIATRARVMAAMHHARNSLRGLA